MYCSRCGKENPDQAAYCAACGAALGQVTPAAAVATRTSGMAIASLVLGILGLCTGVLGIPGLILGIIALKQIGRSRGEVGGQVLAILGVVTSSVALLMLAVVTVILLQAAMLSRTYSRLREKARTTQCLSNVKQISLGLITYTDDYDQRYPYVGSYSGAAWTPRDSEVWSLPMDPYVKSLGIVACPSAGCFGYAGDGTATSRPFTYFFNRRLSGKREDELAYPQNCIMIGDWAPYGADAKGIEDSTTWDIARSEGGLPAGSWEAAERHLHGSTYGFVDGHAKVLRRNDILSVLPEATKAPLGYERRPSLWP